MTDAEDWGLLIMFLQMGHLINQSSRAFHVGWTTMLACVATMLACVLTVSAYAQQGQGDRFRAEQQQQANGAAVVPAGANANRSPFDFSKNAGEHPLDPVVRVMQVVKKNLDQNVRDYSCTLVKQEMLDGELGDRQHLFMKFRNEPFSVYMKFLEPHKDREVLYVAGQNDGKLIALECGLKRMIGPVALHPEGMIAMKGQRYPITRIGMHNLVGEYIRLAGHDNRFKECEVYTNPNVEIDGHSTTMIQVVHPIPRREFRSHIARVFLDNQRMVPLYYDSYTWPTKQGDPPPMEESYMYKNLQLNVGLTGKDFDKNNPEIFQ